MGETTGESTHNIVFVGGSFAGLPTAHVVLKDVLPTIQTGKTYKVYLISPNSEIYWKVGAPRTIVNPSALPIDKAFLKISDGFKSYNKDQFEHIEAFATSIDPEKQTVSYGSEPGTSSSSLHYDSLVLASGTSFKNPMWSIQSGDGHTKAALEEIHKQIPNAKKIMIIGGGAAGTETAGEFGSFYGNKKDVTLLTGAAQPLSRLQDARVGKDAQSRLEKMGIKVLNNVLYESFTKAPEGKTTVKLNNGTEEVVDVVIEATGDKPNSSFIPKDWLNERGFVKNNTATLRLDVPDVKNVYAIGSVASYSNGGIPDIIYSYKILGESIRIDLAGESECPFVLN
ncbi:MAG: hypothetical protein Q9227_008654 [Pyrenula ochraceoflavens]